MHVHFRAIGIFNKITFLNSLIRCLHMPPYLKSFHIQWSLICTTYCICSNDIDFSTEHKHISKKNVTVALHLDSRQAELYEELPLKIK